MYLYICSYFVCIHLLFHLLFFFLCVYICCFIDSCLTVQRHQWSSDCTVVRWCHEIARSVRIRLLFFIHLVAFCMHASAASSVFFFIFVRIHLLLHGFLLVSTVPGAHVFQMFGVHCANQPLEVLVCESVGSIQWNREVLFFMA